MSYGFRGSVDAAKRILTELSETSPDLLAQAHIRPDDWASVLRATIESMRGSAAATMKDKRRFIDGVLRYCQQVGVVESWEFIGSAERRHRRQDYRVTLPGGTSVAIEAKGCGDGENTNIWDRPSWADEFVVWSLCPESLAKDPGEGVWSAVSNRLMQKITAEHQRVEAFIFWDGRCGTLLRRCPKEFGVHGNLRSQVTDLAGQPGKEDWVPPPCIYMLPKSWPTVPANREPPLTPYRLANLSKRCLAPSTYLLTPADDYVHSAEVEARGTEDGVQIKVTTVSRYWPDGDERVHKSRWKAVRES